jgi:hypothetical protein
MARFPNVICTATVHAFHYSEQAVSALAAAQRRARRRVTARKVFKD